jgi:DNA-binding beta-propeller fold protein YncE
VAAPAALGADRVFWANGGNHTIAYANLDGSGGGGQLNTSGSNPDGPRGVAVDLAAGRIYWANQGNDTIAYANLDGSGGGDELDTSGATIDRPHGLTIDPAAGRIYWANDTGNPISYANLDGSGGDDLNTSGSNPDGPYGTAIAPGVGRIYWANRGEATNSDSISYANLDGSGGGGELNISGATISKPHGVAIDPVAGRIYWANLDNTIGYANIDGSGGGGLLNLSGSTPLGVVAVAIDPTEGRIYFANLGNSTISYANLDGSGGGGQLSQAGATRSGARFMVLVRAPVATASPQIQGGSTVGSSLSCSRGSWAIDLLGAFLYRAPDTFAYQWSLDGADIAGATSAFYTAEAPGSYTCRVTATNAAGSTAQTSAAHAVLGSSPAAPVLAAVTAVTADTTPPTLSLLKFTPEAFRAARAGASIARAEMRTRVSYRASEAATTTFRVKRAVSGVKPADRCVKPSPTTKRGRRCTRFVAVRGSFRHADVAGANDFRFTGRIGGRALKPGKYRLDATAKDAAGNVGRAVRARFRIMR